MDALNKALVDYDEEFQKATTFAEQEAVSLRYESIIDAAEREAEEALEKQFQEENQALIGEQEQAQKELEESLKPEPDPVEPVKANSVKSVDQITKEYKTSELKQLLSDHKISGRSRLNTERKMIEALLEAGVEL